MKKILALVAATLFVQTVLFAQTGKAVSDQNVPERFVKDFTRQIKNPKDVQWYQIDSMVYDAHFINENGTETSCRFSAKGTETRWYVKDEYYPHAIVDTVHSMYPKAKIKELYALQIKNKVTYQALIGQRKGLFVKRWKNMHYLNFETDCKFISDVAL